MVTPKRPEATCLIAERIGFIEPSGSGLYRSGSSPPSPVFDLPPSWFIAIASVECASIEIEPKLIAPVANHFTISFAGSTSLSGMLLPFLKRMSPRSVHRSRALLFAASANFR